jgi:hypothetical protein
MNRKMVYTPREIACKTVTVTEPYECPTPTVRYPYTPDISFVGTNGECRITIDVGSGNTIAGLATNESFVRVDTGNGWVYMNEYVNPSASLQTVDLAWEMDITGDYWVHVETQIVSSCGKTSGVISSEQVQYIAPEVVTCPHPTTHFASGCDLLLHYDTNNDGLISSAELSVANSDVTTGALTQGEYNFVSQARYNSINSVCPGCYVPGVADIVATEIVVTPSTCEAPCSISIGITWQNVGTETGSFYPGYDMNGVPVSESSEIILSQGATLQRVYTDTLPDAGSYVICPLPN